MSKVTNPADRARERGVQTVTLGIREPFLDLVVQLMNAVSNDATANGRMEFKRVRQGPVVFEGMEAAGNKPVGDRPIPGRTLFHPGIIQLIAIKGGHQRQHPPPDVRPGPDDAGAARTTHPFVPSGNEEIDAGLGNALVDRSQTVHAIHDEQSSVALFAIGIGLRTASATALSGRRSPLAE